MIRDNRPHSRACGTTRHGHGPYCSENCPSCHGRSVAPPRWCGCPIDAFHMAGCPMLERLSTVWTLPGSGWITPGQLRAAVEDIAWVLEGMLQGRDPE